MSETVNYADVLWERTQRHIVSGETNPDNIPSDFLTNKDSLYQKVQEVISFVNQQSADGVDGMDIAANIIDTFPWMKELYGATESGAGFATDEGVLGQITMIGMSIVRDRDELQRPPTE